MKSSINIQHAAASALLRKPGRTATFEEIATIIEKDGLFANRKSAISLAREIELRITVGRSKYNRWFSITKPGTLTLTGML